MTNVGLRNMLLDMVPQAGLLRLLVAQGNHGIHLRCPPIGDIRCGDGDRRQEDGDAGEDDPIARVYAVEQACHDSRQSQPSDQADANSSKRGDHSLTKNEPQYVFTLRAERQANTDLARASQDRVCLLYTSPSPRDRTRSRMPS